MGINVLDFKVKDKPHYEKVEELLGTDRFACFWLDGDNNIKFSFGVLTAKDVAYIEKIISMIATDTIRENTELEIS